MYFLVKLLLLYRLICALSAVLTLNCELLNCQSNQDPVQDHLFTFSSVLSETH